MGVLFPLVVPTVCQLAPDDRDIQIQTAAAILSSCVLGNCKLCVVILIDDDVIVISPIADVTVLARVSTQCDMNSHLKTCAVSNLYSVTSII